MAAGAGVNDFECGRSIQQTPDGGYRLKGVMILPITVMQVQPNVDMMYESSNWKQNLRRNRAVTKLNRIIECKKKSMSTILISGNSQNGNLTIWHRKNMRSL